MNIGIDIDGTIAGRNMQAFALACSERFGFHLASEPMTYASLMNHPAMLAQRASDQFEQEIIRIEQAPAILRAALPLPGAIAGIKKLAQYAPIVYYTVRKGYPPYSSEDVESATKEWLRESQFPASEQVTFCKSLVNKLMQVYRQLCISPERFVLIDDLAPELMTAFKLLQEGHHPVLTDKQCRHVVDILQQHLILVAFGTSNVAITNDLPVHCLQNWERVDELIQFCFS
jgi:uncharacterized HAD superfamily protein